MKQVNSMGLLKAKKSNCRKQTVGRQIQIIRYKDKNGKIREKQVRHLIGQF